MSKNLNLSSLDFSDIEQSKMSRELIDHLFMLKEQLEYTLSNLGTDNWNQKELEIFAEKISVKGAVTFEDLANGDETVINGAYIKSGVVEASTFRTFLEKHGDASRLNGSVSMYYVPDDWTWDDTVKYDDGLAGGLMLDDRSGTDDEETMSRYCVWLYTRNCFTNYSDSNTVSLKLSSEYRASLEAAQLIYIKCSNWGRSLGQVKIIAGDYDENGKLDGGVITLTASIIRLEGSVYVNGSLIS